MVNEAPRRIVNAEEICHLSDHNTREDEIAALKAELFQAKAAAEHWQKRTEQTEKERAAFRDDAKRLQEALEDVRKKDGPGCDGSPAGPCYYIADAALAPKPVVPACEHNWVSADNEHVTGCEICTKCKSIRPAQARSSKINDDINDPSPDGM
jgi:hypothetical protein